MTPPKGPVERAASATERIVKHLRLDNQHFIEEIILDEYATIEQENQRRVADRDAIILDRESRMERQREELGLLDKENQRLREALLVAEDALKWYQGERTAVADGALKEVQQALATDKRG